MAQSMDKITSQRFDASRFWISDSASELAAMIQSWSFSEIQDQSLPGSPPPFSLYNNYFA